MADFDARSEPPDQPGAGPDDLEGLLVAHRPGMAPARPEFHDALGKRFTRAAEARRGAPGGRRWRLVALPCAPRLAYAAGVLGVAVVLATAWWVARSPRVPPAMTRTTLLEHNAAAWADTATMVGSFSTGDGWYFEEWLRRGTNGVMFKRYSRPPARMVLRPQWNVSDGRTEWVVDADTGTVRAERPPTWSVSPVAPPQERMQCAALALPPGLADGPDPVPALLGGEAVYRLTGRTADGQMAVFWIDARDFLVRRIDRPNGATVWARHQLRVGQELAADLFQPDALANL
jgi:hypothetical protein